MAVEVKPRTAFILLLFVLVAGVVGSSVIAVATDQPSPQKTDESLVAVSNNSEIWPYTSRSTSFHGKTLALNMLIYGDGEVVRNWLILESLGEWNETSAEGEDLEPGQVEPVLNNTTNITWGQASGANRYVYVETESSSGTGQWISESFQLHDGTYFGSRNHIRAYESPSVIDHWVVFQAHREHWDWFRLRHVVDSEEEAQLHVERDLEGRWGVEDYHRIKWGNDQTSLDANGWTTEVVIRDFSAIATLFFWVFSLVGIQVASERIRLRWREFNTEHPRVLSDIGHALVLIIVVVSLYMLVRFGSIFIEQSTTISPKLIAGPFYAFLVVSLPIGTYLSARKLTREHAFGVGVIGFTVAFLLDYSYIGIHVLPIDLLLHRFILAIALGFIAAGASKTVRRDKSPPGLVRSGVLMWVTAVLLPLLYFF